MKRIFSALFVAFCGIVFSAFAQQPPPKSPTLVVPPIVMGDRAKIVEAEREAQALEHKLASQPTDKSSAQKLYYAYNSLGWQYLWARMYEEAIKAHQRAAEVDRKYIINPPVGKAEKPPKLITQADTFLISGWDQVVRGDHDAALQAYQRAIELNPSLAEARYELGRLYLMLKQKEAAERQLLELDRYDKSLAILLQNEIARSVAPPATLPINTPGTLTTIMQATANLKPTIVYKEKAKYTESARQYRVQGTVLVSAVFTADGHIINFRVIRGLPMGLTETAIEAAEKIRFTPATKDGQPVSVRMSMEFSFNLL